MRVPHVEVSLGERVVIRHLDFDVELVSEGKVAGADVDYPCRDGHSLHRGTHIAAVVVLAGGKELDLATAVLQTFAGHLVSIAKPVRFRIATPEVDGVKSVPGRFDDADRRAGAGCNYCTCMSAESSRSAPPRGVSLLP